MVKYLQRISCYRLKTVRAIIRVGFMSVVVQCYFDS